MTIAAKNISMKRKKFNWLGVLMCTVAALPAYLAVESASVRAGDLDSPQATSEEGHFIRIGLKKSVVIKAACGSP